VVASFTVKGIPDELLDRLRSRAVRERRSLTQEIIHLLESALSGQGLQEARRALAEAERQTTAWSELVGRWRSDRPVAEEIGEIYEARTTGRAVDL